MSAARIGKIRMKSGGAEVRLFRQETPNPHGQNYCGLIVDHARKIAEHDEPGSRLVGYVVLGLYEDGKSSVGWRYDSDSTAIPRALLPHFVSEVIRRDLLTEPVAESVAVDVFNRSI